MSKKYKPLITLSKDAKTLILKYKEIVLSTKLFENEQCKNIDLLYNQVDEQTKVNIEEFVEAYDKNSISYYHIKTMGINVSIKETLDTLYEKCVNACTHSFYEDLSRLSNLFNLKVSGIQFEEVQRALLPFVLKKAQDSYKTYLDLILDYCANYSRNIAVEVISRYKELSYLYLECPLDYYSVEECLEYYLVMLDNISDIDPEVAVYISDTLHANRVKEVMDDTLTNKVNSVFIGEFKKLNSIAEDTGYIFERINGDHGIFKHHKSNKCVVIPQRNGIGKGLSLTIQKQIISNSFVD